MPEHYSFGRLIHDARVRKGLSLRDAARRLGPVSPTYLSKIENERCDPPSGSLIRRIAELYEIPLERLLRFAKGRESEVVAEVVGERSDLRLLLRLARGRSPEEVKKIIAALVNSLPPEEQEKWRRMLTTEFTRLGRGRNDLLAPALQPRFLSRTRIRQIADQVLVRAGIQPAHYVPPTPIEAIVEGTPGLRLTLEDGPAMSASDDIGGPCVLGLSRWGMDGTRVVAVNGRLYDDSDAVARHRLNYTLAHELFHAIEHLPLMEGTCRDGHLLHVSVAEPARRACPEWVESGGGRRRLRTAEDWQEWQAQAFAAEILMPQWHVRREFVERLGRDRVVVAPGENVRRQALDLAAADHIARSGVGLPLHDLYAVSRQAMAIRLLELNLVVPSAGKEVA